jgi:formylglycine-generating enzyme required for sulfatase activity
MIQSLCLAVLLISPGTSAPMCAAPVEDPAPLSYDSLLAAGQTALDEQLWRDALRFSAVAVGTRPGRHEAYVIASIALHATARHVLALEALNSAIQRAPAKDRELLESIRLEIEESTNELAFEEHVKAGRAALEQNLAALAARELTAAWNLKPEKLELALEAAAAWTAVQEYGPARALLLAVLKSPAKGPATEQAREFLSLVEPLVLHRYSAELAKAEGHSATNRLPAAESLLLSAALLVPERPEAYFALARLAVLQVKPDAAVLHVRRAIARGGLQRGQILGDSRLLTLADHPGFQELVKDTFGEQALAQLKGPTPWQMTVTEELTNSVGMLMKRLRPDRFTMGSPASEENRDVLSEVQTDVTLSTPFYLATTEVTQAQWMALMDSNPSVQQGDELPVQRVTWIEAAEFCRRLSEAEGVLYRLPTEAEWEFACRAGQSAAYSSGPGVRGLDSVAWYQRSFARSPQPRPQPQAVGQLERNAWGFADMHGNVYEWVLDYYAPFSGDPLTDPIGPELGTLRVVRGGAFTSQASACRSAHRGRYASTFRAPDIGFRVLRELD